MLFFLPFCFLKFCADKNIKTTRVQFCRITLHGGNVESQTSHKQLHSHKLNTPVLVKAYDLYCQHETITV